VRVTHENPSEAETDSEAAAYQERLETVTFHNREYQRYAIENGVYYAPIDEVTIALGCLLHNPVFGDEV